MDAEYQIDFIDSLYMSDFYDDIIPKLHDYFHYNKEKNLIFNFSDLKFISPNVVPNLLNIADIYKKYLQEERTIELILSYNYELLSFLDSVHFFSISDDLKLFSYDHNMIGGFKEKSTDNCSLIFSKANSNEDEIKKECNELMQNMERCIEIEGNINKHKDTFKEIFFHLIHNANDKDRGDSNAYGSFKVNSYKDQRTKYGILDNESFPNRAYIAVCDNGVGIMKSINDKYNKKEAIPYFTKYGQTAFYYILEAIFWRKINPPFPFIHGLYDVTKILLDKGGKIGINSDETYIVFDRSFFKTFLLLTKAIAENSEPDDETLVELKRMYIRKTKNKKYRGVHIDIELPLEWKQ